MKPDKLHAELDAFLLFMENEVGPMAFVEAKRQIVDYVARLRTELNAVRNMPRLLTNDERLVIITDEMERVSDRLMNDKANDLRQDAHELIEENLNDMTDAELIVLRDENAEQDLELHSSDVVEQLRKMGMSVEQIRADPDAFLGLLISTGLETAQVDAALEEIERQMKEAK